MIVKMLLGPSHLEKLKSEILNSPSTKTTNESIVIPVLENKKQ